MSPLTCAENLRRIELLVNVTTTLRHRYQIVALGRAAVPHGIGKAVL